MGIGRRLIDLARANLNALLDRAAAAEGGPDLLSDDELRDRESSERAARERAEERARAAARSAGRTPRPQSARKPPPRRPPPPRPGSERRLRELYAQLETPYGAPFDDVKKSFRRLMRKYHPDLHARNPKKHKAATELTMQLTTAYNEIELLLKP